MAQKSLTEEIESFQDIWKGGYFEGDPLDPVGRSGYGSFGYYSILHVTYLRCIKPYIRPETHALEIGPGRGGWTRAMLPAKEVWTLDAMSAEHNGFYEFLKYPENVKYLHVSDFLCSELPEDHFDFMFSFGCLCHVSFEGITEYAKNIFPKLRKGANCFWLVGDKKKWAEFIQNEDRYNIWRSLASGRRELTPVKLLIDRMAKRRNGFRDLDLFQDREARWYDSGSERVSEMLRSLGYEIIDSDVGTIPRDPIIHFVKP